MKKEQEIKRSEFTDKKGSSLEENKAVQSKDSFQNVVKKKADAPKEKAGEDKKKVKTGLNGDQAAGAKINQLKESGKMLPVIMPEKKALTKEEALLKVQNYHERLEEAESSLFNDKERSKISRNRFKNLWSGEKEKRAKEALRRQKNAEKILEAEEGISKLRYTDEEFDRSGFEKYLRDFVKMSWEPYPMDNDENFANNLLKNYRYCMDVEKFAQMVDQAVAYGYFPKEVNLEEVHYVEAFRCVLSG